MNYPVKSTPKDETESELLDILDLIELESNRKIKSEGEVKYWTDKLAKCNDYDITGIKAALSVHKEILDGQINSIEALNKQFKEKIKERNKKLN